MKVTVDTNILLRAALGDEPAQTKAAAQTLREATVVVISLASLCEFIWVVRRLYGLSKTAAALSLRSLIQANNVAVDDLAVEAGFAALEAGADFADGVIAHQGRQLGGEVFVSFDRKAVSAVEKQGFAARLLR